MRFFNSKKGDERTGMAAVIILIILLVFAIWLLWYTGNLREIMSKIVKSLWSK